MPDQPTCPRRGCSGTLIESAWKEGELWCVGNPHWHDKGEVDDWEDEAKLPTANG